MKDVLQVVCVIWLFHVSSCLLVNNDVSKILIVRYQFKKDFGEQGLSIDERGFLCILRYLTKPILN